MTNSPFVKEGSRLLTCEVFDLVLGNELRRALRSQNFLTLVVIEASREWDGLTLTADQRTMFEVAQIVQMEVRSIDLVGHMERGIVSIVLLDADLEHSTRVIDRLIAKIENYGFTTALRVAVGAACYPTHAVDAASLKRQALARPVAQWRGGGQVTRLAGGGQN